jgi:hypothetical protein
MTILAARSDVNQTIPGTYRSAVCIQLAGTRGQVGQIFVPVPVEKFS